MKKIVAISFPWIKNYYPHRNTSACLSWKNVAMIVTLPWLKNVTTNPLRSPKHKNFCPSFGYLISIPNSNHSPSHPSFSFVFPMHDTTLFLQFIFLRTFFPLRCHPKWIPIIVLPQFFSTIVHPICTTKWLQIQLQTSLYLWLPKMLQEIRVI